MEERKRSPGGLHRQHRWRRSPRYKGGIMTNEPEEQQRTWTETIELAGSEIVDRLKEIVKAGNVRRLIIRNAEDHVLMEIPLTAGFAAGAIGVLLAPIWIALGAMAAVLARVKVEIVRQNGDDGGEEEEVEEEDD